MKAHRPWGITAGRVLALALACAPVGQASAQVVISQINGNGGLTIGGTPDPFDRDFVELFNRGSTPVNVDGWSVQLFSDNGSTTSPATLSWDVVPLSGTILPGQYYLITPTVTRGSSGSTFTTPPLPVPDVEGDSTSGTLLISEANAVALMRTTAQIPDGVCPVGDANLVDLLHHGHPNALCFEGSAPAPQSLLSGNRAVTRLQQGCQDTNQNASDFVTDQSPNPRNSSVNGFVNVTLSQASVTQGTGGAVTLVAARAGAPCNPMTAPLSGATADLSAFGLSAAQALFDDGTNGDAAAGDGLFSVQFTVAPGQTAGKYVIPVSATGGAVTLPTSATLRVFPPAATNDTCATAFNLGGLGSTLTLSVNTTQATPDTDAGTCNGDSQTRHGVWYTFTAPANGALRITESSTEDVIVARFANCASATSAACIRNESVDFPVVAGTAYYFLIGQESGTSVAPQVPLQLAFSFEGVPANDAPCGAASIAAMPFSAAPNAAAASNETVDVACNSTTSNPVARHGVWYTFQTGAQPGVLEFFENSTNGTNFTLFTGGSCGSLVEASCVDESFSGALAPVLPNTTYWLLLSIDSGTAVPNQPYDFSVRFIPAPSNDQACGAAAISLPSELQVNVRAATTDQAGTVSACSGTGTTRYYGVWYTYTSGPGETGGIRISDRSSNDVFYHAYTGPNCGSLTFQECFGQWTNDDIFMTVQPNTTYWVLVTLQSTGTGTSPPSVPSTPYDLKFEFVPFPANDTACGATSLTSFPFVDRPAISFATNDVATTCIYQIPAQSETNSGVWYTYTPGADTFLRVQDTASDEVMWALFTGPNCSSLTEAACEDLGAVGYDTNHFALRAGSTYWILVGKVAGSEPFGSLDLNFSLVAAVGACCVGETCSIRTRGDCAAVGGTYTGSFNSCGDVPQYVNSTPAAIPDRETTTSPASQIVVPLNVPDGVVINDLKVLVDINHATSGDLEAFVTSPGGIRQDIFSRLRDSSSFGEVNTCPPLEGGQAALVEFGDTYIFDDQAYDPDAISIGDAARIYASAGTGDFIPGGHYRPNTCNELPASLAAFNGQNSFGEWTLTIRDYDRGGTGTLNSWGLIINGGLTPPCSVCRADFNQSGAVDVADIFAFLSAWFAQVPAANFNGDASINVSDIFAFLSAWFAGCD